MTGVGTSGMTGVGTSGMTGNGTSGMTGNGMSGMTGDGLKVETERGPGLLKGGAYTSHHDHRMVMALKVAALGADSPITIDDEDCVAKSFPQFHDIFAQII